MSETPEREPCNSCHGMGTVPKRPTGPLSPEEMEEARELFVEPDILVHRLIGMLDAAEERARKAEEERDEARAERERLEQIIAAVQTDLVRSYPNWITGKHDLPWLDAIAAEQARIRADDEEGA